MAETENVKTMENLNKDKNERNGIESINDSGIEMNEEKEKIERNLSIKCPWILGQLAWARGSSYPFWPCVVTLDPTTLLYFKVQNKGRSQALMVHVQYFGDGGRHNWVLSHYMIPFVGLEDFKARAKSITPEIKKKDPKFAAAFTPKMGVKKQWGIGVTEASGLMHLSNEDRASIFEPVIPEEKTVQLTNKLKRKLSPKGSKFPSDTPNSSSKKLKKIENDEQSQSQTPSTQQSESSNQTEESLSNKIVTAPAKESSSNAYSTARRKSTRNQNKNSIELPKRQNLRKKNSKLSEEERIRRDEIDFEDYYNLNKDFWKSDNPDATDEEIRKLLQEIWDDMDAEEKHNNLNRNFDNYRYNLPDNSKAKRVKKTPLHQEKENSKNSENAQHESNKNILQVNGKTEESVKTSEVVKNKLSPQKEKNKKNEKETNNVSKEKGKISEKEKNNSDDGNIQKEKNKISPSDDDNLQKEEKKNTESIDENVEQKENKNSDSDDKEIVKEKEKISETNEDTQQKETNKVICELIPPNDNSPKKNGKPEINDNVEKDKKKGNSKTKNSQNAKTKKEKVLKRKNNSSEKEVSTKESNKEKKIADDQSIKG
ncbi:histone-lysine N-methyltransferase NSD2-like [Leptopilina heterotoma]|uniref:histone-lysine N-methyltransferase NSD2-like n=1 Tax=Leptopilina heterotoma TaxID=63436 RepID=UPI001CA96122|nr:histone-lysine N-methyltransferase NSD2-like [Leptopilina heterotoma]